MPTELPLEIAEQIKQLMEYQREQARLALILETEQHEVNPRGAAWNEGRAVAYNACASMLEYDLLHPYAPEGFQHHNN